MDLQQIKLIPLLQYAIERSVGSTNVNHCEVNEIWFSITRNRRILFAELKFIFLNYGWYFRMVFMKISHYVVNVYGHSHAKY